MTGLKFIYDDNDDIRYTWMLIYSSDLALDVDDVYEVYEDFDGPNQMRREMIGQSTCVFSSAKMVR